MPSSCSSSYPKHQGQPCFWVLRQDKRDRLVVVSLTHTHIEPSFGRFFFPSSLAGKKNTVFFFFSSFLSLSLSLLLSSEFSSLRLLCSRGRLMRMLYTLSLFLFILLLLFSFSLRGRLSAFGHPVRHATHALHVAPSTHTHTTGREKRSFFFFVILVGLAIDGRENRNGIE